MTKPYVNPRRREQLQQLLAAGAVSRETAVCASFDYNWSPGVLSRMIDEGFVAQAQLPFEGDSRRRLSHYWLTDAGRAIVE